VGILGLRAVLLSKTCDRYQSVLSTDTQGRTLRSTFEACSFIGNQNEQWVDLELPSGKSERVMSFEPWGGEVASLDGVDYKPPFDPVATWHGANELEISIGTIGHLLEARDNVAGVHVTYKIGAIVSK
jgi:hypothetical protein